MTLDQFQQLRHWHLCHRYDHPLEGRIWSTLVTLWMIGWVGTPTAWLLHWDETALATAALVFVPGAVTVPPTPVMDLLARLHLPLLRRSALAAALLVFVDVMKELPATMVLRPFNSDTLAVVAYQLARDERLGEAALPCLALVLVGLIPVILLSRTLRSGPGRQG